MRAYAHLLDDPSVAALLDGLVDHVGLRVGDEAWTFSDGVLTDGIGEPDYVVALSPEEVVAAAARVELGPLDDAARFALVRKVLGPVLVSSAMSKHLWAWPYRTGVVNENLVHLTVSDGTREARFTLIMVNVDWLCFEGHHGTPVRAVVLTAEEALELCRQVLKAMREKSVRAWLWFVPWWTQFRDAHSTLFADVPDAPWPVEDHDHHHDHDH